MTFGSDVGACRQSCKPLIKKWLLILAALHQIYLDFGAIWPKIEFVQRSKSR
jgi:hypothetical protein